MAKTRPNKQVLYQRAVQDAGAEVSFLTRTYRTLRKKEPRILREDFCGTALVCCEWVREVEGGEAFGVDLHEPTLNYGRKHNLSTLEPEEVERLQLIRADVLEKRDFKADIVCALNFSYFIFKERKVLLDYARYARQGLKKDGLFVLDIYGGPDAQKVQEETTNHGDFTYVWDQTSYNPVSGRTKCKIHFRFPRGGGKPMRNAFVYDWRLWSLPELRDVLIDAGFRKADVFWEGTDPKTNEGNGKFSRTTKGDDAESWIAYVVASR